jgi:hypothetical protein
MSSRIHAATVQAAMPSFVATVEDLSEARGPIGDKVILPRGKNTAAACPPSLTMKSVMPKHVDCAAINNRKQAYKRLCAEETSIPLFSRDWWLDAAAGAENWDIALVEKKGRILASMPYVIKRKLGLKISTHPSLTQTLGPWLRPSEAKYPIRLGQQKDLLQELISQLPSFDHFQQKWHYSQTNWLPFFWHGYTQTTNYTYILNELHDEKVVWDGLNENIRREVRKAAGKAQLEVLDNASLDDFLPLNRLVFKRQKRRLPYSETYVASLDAACASRNCRKIFIAQDKQGRPHAGVYIIWDKNSAYYLMGGGDPELRNSGATSLCMWEAIKFASTVTKRFDFEGSMIEPVERFFRAFGGVQTPYFSVSKTPSKLLSLFLFLRARSRLAG